MSVLSSPLQVVDFFNGNLKRRRQKRKEAKAMMKLKRLSTIHTEANGAVIGNTHTHTHTHTHTQIQIQIQILGNFLSVIAVRGIH